jgi:hypothetical protein
LIDFWLSARSIRSPGTGPPLEARPVNLFLYELFLYTITPRMRRHGIIGAAYLQDRALDKAENAFKRAHDANPQLTDPLVNPVRTFIKEGSLNLARQTCDSLAAIEPKIADQTRPEIP